MELWDAIYNIPGIGPMLPYLAALVTLASAMAPLLPPPKEQGWYAWSYHVVNFVAMNLGHAKNATAPAKGNDIHE